MRYPSPTLGTLPLLISLRSLSPILAATLMPPRGRPTLVVLSLVTSSSARAGCCRPEALNSCIALEARPRRLAPHPTPLHPSVIPRDASPAAPTALARGVTQRSLERPLPRPPPLPRAHTASLRHSAPVSACRLGRSERGASPMLCSPATRCRPQVVRRRARLRRTTHRESVEAAVVPFRPGRLECSALPARRHRLRPAPPCTPKTKTPQKPHLHTWRASRPRPSSIWARPRLWRRSSRLRALPTAGECWQLASSLAGGVALIRLAHRAQEPAAPARRGRCGAAAPRHKASAAVPRPTAR